MPKSGFAPWKRGSLKGDLRMGTSLDKGWSEQLSPHAIQEDLRTRWMGQSDVYCFDAVESTNSEAKRLARAGATEGTLVAADAQTKGRGRLGRPWVSPPGEGLYMSLILRPDCPPDWLPRLTLTAGVAAASAIRQMGIKPQLKWPNDILLLQRKVGGILTEAVFDRKRVDFAILGIGVNVNAEEDDFPVSLRRLATSLRISLGEPVSRIGLLQALLYQLELWYETFCTGAFGEIRRSWGELDVTLGKMVEVFLPDKRISGVAEDLSSDGALLVRDKDGLHRIVAGDVVNCRLGEGSVKA